MTKYIVRTVAVAAVFGILAIATQAFDVREHGPVALADVTAGADHSEAIAPILERKVGVSRQQRGTAYRTAWIGERPAGAGRDQKARSEVRAAKGAGCDHACRSVKRVAALEADFFETGAAERGCRRMRKAGGDCGVGDTYWLVMR
ncbi:hypothetical protein [Amaricoccus tamworthensis]|uniref:hypothetical protein n=1 Tax=Amaricoccus tamworthensis TaxID=57002 RepID=UPI003C7EB5F6